METADRILDAAEQLCRRQGIKSVSFRDLADLVGVKSASVHYHFPTKDDLARALILRYRHRFEQLLEEIGRRETTPTGRLKRFFATMDDIFGDAESVCLASSFAAERELLSDDVLLEVRRFYESVEGWIGQVLTQGMQAQELRLAGRPLCTAKVMFAAVAGTILACRAGSGPGRLRELGEYWLRALHH